MHDISHLFSRFKSKKDKLIKFGFRPSNNTLIIDKKSTYKNFTFHIEIKDKQVLYTVIDNNTNEEYIPFFIESINGEYVGKIREEFDLLIKSILSTCYEKDYSNNYVKKVIKYIKEKYNIDPSYLFADSPNTCVFKHKEAKWFGIIMDIPYTKVGIESKEIVYVMHVKTPTNNMEKLIKKPGIKPAYHMNKKYWISILLDGSISMKSIAKLIDTSYDLTK